VSIFCNSLFNPDSAHGLLGNSTINLLAPYPFSCLNSLMIVCKKYHFLIVLLILYVDCVNKSHLRSSNCSLCNAILVTKIFCYRYSTINNSAEITFFSTKFDICFSNLLGITCAKFYSDSLRFDIFIVQCIAIYFFTGHSVDHKHSGVGLN